MMSLLISSSMRLSGRVRPVMSRQRAVAAVATGKKDGLLLSFDEPSSGDTTKMMHTCSSNRRSFASSTSLLGERPLLIPKQKQKQQLKNHQTTQIRWSRKGAKMGQHLQKLDEMAHGGESEAAQERRKKKKDRKAAKKHKGDKHETTTTAEATAGVEAEPDKEMEEEEEPEEEHDETILPETSEVKRRMQVHVEKYKEYLKGVRGGEPTPEFFDGIAVMDAYGKGTGASPLKAVAQVVIASPTLAMATCFDPATTKAVALAIRDKLDLNPQPDDDGVIKIPLPRVSMESRKQTAAAVSKRAELFRQRVHQTRNKAMAVVKKGVAGQLEHVSKDDAFRVQNEIEKIKDAAITEINALTDAKNEDIMRVS